MVEQEVTTWGIKMSRRIELILITKQETIVLPGAKSTVAQGVLVAIKVKYNERKLNQQNGNIVRRVSRDWSKGIHSLNIIPRPNPQQCMHYDVFPNSLKDPKVGPRAKQWKKKRVGARSLTYKTARVGGRVGVPGWD